MTQPTTPTSEQEVRARLIDATRACDIAGQMQIVSQQINVTEGAKKAYWLRYRAALRQIYGTAEQAALVEADLTEARRAAPHDPEIIFYEAMERCLGFERIEELRAIPASMRPLIRTKLFGIWRYWLSMGNLHYVRRRWHQSYRSFGKSIALLEGLPPEEYVRVAGYTIYLRSTRARAALRCNRPDAAALEVDLATEFDARKERKYMHPIPLALARAELALHHGRFQDARTEIQQGLTRLAASPTLKAVPRSLIDQDLLAARIARAEGNDIGFRHFAERALALAIEGRLTWTEATIRAVMDGAPF